MTSEDKMIDASLSNSAMSKRRRRITNRRVETVDRTAEIERLAALDPINYEVVRADAAERLSVRASALDRAVEKSAVRLVLKPNRATTAKAAP